jgi:hypothetical protein
LNDKLIGVLPWIEHGTSRKFELRVNSLSENHTTRPQDR